jgi:hypothetical protein
MDNIALFVPAAPYKGITAHNNFVRDFSPILNFKNLAFLQGK